MKKLLTITFISIFSLFAQAARNVNLSWTASTSTSVTGYNVYRSTNTIGPGTLLTPSPIVGTAFVDVTAQTGNTYTYFVSAVAPACTPTTPVTATCGESAKISSTTTVPPVPTSVVSITVVVP